jgi:rod shape determining protein RodA
MRVERSQSTALVTRPHTSSWHQFDIQLAFYALALGIIGLVMAWTNSPADALQPGSTFTRGLIWFAVAIVAFSLAAAFDYRWLRTFSWLVYLVNIGLLVLTLAVGSGVGGVQRWVTIFGLQFQFSEISKVLMIAVLAAYLAARQGKLDNLSTLIGAGLLTAPPFVLVMIQPDLGTSLVFGAILVGALFLSGAGMRWLALAAAVAVSAMPVIWAVLQDYQRQRILSFFDPSSDPQGAGYQVIQSQIAVGSGGMFGKGLTNGTQSAANLLPVQSTDFAFAGLLEQLGFVGGLVVFLLFVGLIWRVLLVGWRSDSVFGVAFAGGVTAMLVFQLLVNAGMVAGIMPVTGIPLPFITHGGASLTSTAIALGVLQSIHMHVSRAPW